MSVEIILFNDLHLADKPPALRKEGYFEEGMAMLCELVEAARIENACLVTSGDLFHLKSPLKNSLSMLGQVIDAIRPIGRLYVVPGNHDLNTRGTLEGQPLELLEKACVVHILRGATLLNSIKVVSRPYSMEHDTNPRYYALTPEEIAYFPHWQAPILMVAHGSIVPMLSIRPYPHLRIDQIDTTGIDVLASGHIHEDLQITNAGTGSLFVNVGSLGRVAKTYANLTRTVQAVNVSVSPEGGLLLDPRVLSSALPGHAIFSEEKLPEAGASHAEIEVFVQGLMRGMALEQVDLLTLIKSLGLAPTIERRMLYYLETAGV